MRKRWPPFARSCDFLVLPFVWIFLECVLRSRKKAFAQTASVASCHVSGGSIFISRVYCASCWYSQRTYSSALFLSNTLRSVFFKKSCVTMFLPSCKGHGHLRHLASLSYLQRPRYEYNRFENDPFRNFRRSIGNGFGSEKALREDKNGLGMVPC